MGELHGELHLDVLSIGEALIDLIAETELESLATSRRFQMYPGGQATNVTLNAAYLGGSAALVTRVGDDDFGLFLRHHLEAAGVRTTWLHVTPKIPTTLVVVSRNQATPDFVIYRGADAHLSPSDMPLHLLPTTSFIHTSAFALSREPASSSIRDFIIRAYETGCRISFDPNYHPRLWDVAAAPAALFAGIYPYVFVTKPSLDDCIRLFGASGQPEDYARRFLDWGVQHVVLTMGGNGVLLANKDGMTHFPAQPVKVVDVTGAGDSFWAGLLLAIGDGLALPDAVRIAQAVATIKLQQVGPLSQGIDRKALYGRLGFHTE